MRTFVFGTIGLGFLLVGYTLSLLYPTAATAIFGSYATGVVFIVGSIATKHGIDSLALGQGLAGVKKALLTDAKPPEPPAPGGQP